MALTQAYLDRVRRIDPHLGSFLLLTAETALAQAQTAQTEIRAGRYRGPLHGIPLGLKDVFETQGIRTTAGSAILADYVPQRDATVVQKLKTAGAVLLGKLNLSEWTMKPSNDNPFFGPCYNPWDLTRTPGGSSGGAGAALAASLCLGALGSDTGGSVRIPAAWCGMVGLKPTYGRISTQGMLPLSWSLDHVGPMARCVQDLALLLQVIAGYDPSDPWSMAEPVPDYSAQLTTDVQALCVAHIQSDYVAQAETEVLTAINTASDLLGQLGAAVERLDLPQLEIARKMNSIILLGDAAKIHRERLRDDPAGFSPEVLASLRRGAALSAPDYARARQTQIMLRRQIEEIFETYDILLLPTTPTTAPLRHEPPAAAAIRPSSTNFTAPFNLLGFPALSIPCGFSESGLPIGVQLVARPWAEATLLQAGQAYEQATAWRQRKPAL